jgi:hypothetical protein
MMDLQARLALTISVTLLIELQQRYLLRPILVCKPKDLNRDWLPRFSALRDKNGWI